MKTIIATVLFAITAQPAAASEELGAFVAGIITGAIVGSSKSQHTHGYPTHNYPTHSHAPSRHMEYGDRVWNPNVACYTRPEYQHNWVITRWYNCYDQVIRVEKHRR